MTMADYEDENLEKDRGSITLIPAGKGCERHHAAKG
jgi:hypothetical protein